MAHRISLSRPYFDAQEPEAVRRVLESGWVVQGPEVEAFESELARLHSVRHCVAVSSGTAALHLGYLALNIGPDDAVFVPGFAWPSAAHMAKMVGAEPVFVEVLDDTYNIDTADLGRRIEDCLAHGKLKPRVIVPVHEFGLAAEMDSIMKIASRYSLEIIEDAACALGAVYHGRPVGSFGRLGILSFHPRKSITTGEGGAILTNDTALAERCRCWRNHGQQFVNGRRDFVLPGLNYRMTEIQAAVGRVQLSKLASILQKRKNLVKQYLEGLEGSRSLRVPFQSPEHTWQTLMISLSDSIDRAGLIENLAQRGIETGPGSVAAHLAAHFQPQTPLPASERLHRTGLALPLHAGLDQDQVGSVIQAVQDHLKRFSRSSRLPQQEHSIQDHLP